jgi:hypothetical protein
VEVRAGDSSRDKRNRQPIFFACPIRVARVVFASPRAKGNKKTQLHHAPLSWVMADCAFSGQCSSSFTSISVRASYTIYFMLSRTLN